MIVNIINKQNVVNKGYNILTCIDDPNDEILWGWCNVFHQSTENLIMGIFIPPIMHT